MLHTQQLQLGQSSQSKYLGDVLHAAATGGPLDVADAETDEIGHVLPSRPAVQPPLLRHDDLHTPQAGQVSQAQERIVTHIARCGELHTKGGLGTFV